ncbi:MAG TPA: tetratricopeptide repeat protein [Candidatus Limnocylindria bacterium]|nr:tetratricopeptide repeat protein [Candidatus Limnocylindria bacterium]
MKLNDFALPRAPHCLTSRRVNAFQKQIALLLLFSSLTSAFSAQPPPDAPPAASTNAIAASENDTQLLRSFLLLQEQLRATQRAVEQARDEAQSEARRSAEATTARLNLIEQSLSTQRQQQMESLQRTITTVLKVIGISTAAGFLAVLFAGFMQVRAATRLAEVSRQLQLALPSARFAELSAGAGAALNSPPIEAANAHLLGAIDRLQHRLEEMETAASGTQTATNGHKQITFTAGANSQLATLLGKGQTLLNLDKPEEALEHFEQAVALEPHSIEAWIKKGTALERLQRIDEAIAAYDQAIAVDNSTATAYLFKAGVYNRQKKYAEALQCYEKALNAQQKARSAATAA